MSSEDDFRRILKPLFQPLEKLVRDGFRLYFELYRDVLFKHTPRTRASTINDHIVDLAIEALPKFGIRAVRMMQRKLFASDDFLLQFKKLNRQKMTANYPTLFALEFNKQLELPGLPSVLPRLMVGYVPKPDWSGIESVFITCPNGKEIDWFIDLTIENAAATTLPTPVPTSINAKSRIGKRSKRIKRDNDSGENDAAQS